MIIIPSYHNREKTVQIDLRFINFHLIIFETLDVDKLSDYYLLAFES